MPHLSCIDQADGGEDLPNEDEAAAVAVMRPGMEDGDLSPTAAYYPEPSNRAQDDRSLSRFVSVGGPYQGV